VPASNTLDDDGFDDSGPGLGELLLPVFQRLGLIVLAAILGASIGVGGSYLMAPRYVAATTLLFPQQQSAASSALAALSSLSALSGAGSMSRTSADQYISLLRSVMVADRIIDKFGLMNEYLADYRYEARKELELNVRMSIGKKDNLIRIEVEDKSPQRAAQMANEYVEELRRVTGSLAITEAQQRRVFFERQLQDVRGRLTKAQLDLQGSGFSAGALKAEPKAAAESYARLKAETAAAEIALLTLRSRFSDNAPEIQQQLSTLGALRNQLSRAERPVASGDDPDYVGKYREFKYQEALFEVYARQFELARVDEAREGALIQVIDVAQPAERKSKPRRLIWLASGLAAGLAAAVICVLIDAARRRRLQSA
jgi:uncharacterized protein involved in exopolysaccharide biosynthesis